MGAGRGGEVAAATPAGGPRGWVAAAIPGKGGGGGREGRGQDKRGREAVPGGAFQTPLEGGTGRGEPARQGRGVFGGGGEGGGMRGEGTRGEGTGGGDEPGATAGS